MKRKFFGFFLAPRIIAIGYLLFLMLFSLDVFSMETGIMEKTGGFLIHSAPSIAMAVIVALFWKRPFVLGWVFILIAIILTLFFNTYVHMESFLMISVPPLTAGILFLLEKRYRGGPA